MNKLRFSYYADDFTGATDALECLCKAGVRTALFTRPPSAEVLSRYEDLDAVGVAGTTRAMSPDAMEEELSAIFPALVELGAPHIHYKVCSTFDSSPELGSIGRAIDVGRRTIGSDYVPLVVGVPKLGRFCVFGNLFAATHIGAQGQVYRLDRHPTISKHPATPMNESDLRIHLSRQTEAKIALFDVLMLDSESLDQQAQLQRLIAEGSDVVLFDVLDENHLAKVGRLIDTARDTTKPQFSVGSSAVEYALSVHWAASGKIARAPDWKPLAPVTQTLVFSGSCSPVTHRQIEWAVDHGFAEVALDTESIVVSEGSPESIDPAVDQILTLLGAGRSVVVHSSKGSEDPRIASTFRISENGVLDTYARQRFISDLLGNAIGQIARKTLGEASISRICIAGGDTSGRIALQLGIESMQMHYPLFPGAPICRVSAPDSPADSLEIVFKGGQVGPNSFIGSVLGGRD